MARLDASKSCDARLWQRCGFALRSVGFSVLHFFVGNNDRYSLHNGLSSASLALCMNQVGNADLRSLQSELRKSYLVLVIRIHIYSYLLAI